MCLCQTMNEKIVEEETMCMVGSDLKTKGRYPCYGEGIGREMRETTGYVRSGHIRDIVNDEFCSFIFGMYN